MDFLERLKDHLESLQFTPPIIEIGLFNEDGDSVAIRPMPSSIVTRYVSGKIYPYSFQILVHNKNSLLAYQTSQKLVKELDQNKNTVVLSDDNTYILISISNTSTPSFVEETSYGTLWTMTFEAELLIQ